jgi:hypothetical protein
MGVLDLVRGRNDSHLAAAASPGRNDSHLAAAAASPGTAQPIKAESGGVIPEHSFKDCSASDSDSLSLDAQNEKEIQLHPDEITRNADLGIQKAEAAALVWSKKAVYLTYAW